MKSQKIEQVFALCNDGQGGILIGKLGWKFSSLQVD